MAKAHNLIGQRFGRLVVIERAPNRGKRVAWRCKCDCGNIKDIVANKLVSGNTKSCGCLQKESRYGRQSKGYEVMGRNKRLNRIWHNMKARVLDKNHKSYHNYGGRGIAICDEWLNDFIPFANWAWANGYTDDLTLDRIDWNGNYEPKNCRWITVKEQQNNKRNTIFITYNDETKTLTQWAEIIGISSSGLKYRLDNWTLEKAFNTPIQGRK